MISFKILICIGLLFTAVYNIPKVISTGSNQDITYKSETQSIQIIDGKQHVVYLATLTASPRAVCSINDNICKSNPSSDACCAKKFSVQDASGISHTLQFFIEEPYITTSRKLIGWLPRFFILFCYTNINQFNLIYSSFTELYFLRKM